MVTRRDFGRFLFFPADNITASEGDLRLGHSPDLTSQYDDALFREVVRAGV